MKTSILQIDSVTKSFGHRQVLSGVYISARTNEVTSILGRNGCGKSTLFRIMMGEIPAENAHLSIDEVFFPLDKSKKGYLNYLPQGSLIPNAYTPREAFIDYGVEVKNLLDHFPDLEESLDMKIKRLSSGQRRIIETVLVLYSDSLFSILDEPFSQIAPVNVEILQKLILEQRARKGIILTDHQYENIMSVSDVIYIMDEGSTYPVKDENDLRRYHYIR